jgi:glycosyltransferase involved in cell wall biosynthesis
MHLNGYFKKLYFVYFLADQGEEFWFTPDILVRDFRARGPDKIRAWGLRVLAAALQEILFIAEQYDRIRRDKITHIQANDPYIEGINAFFLARITRLPYAVRSNCDYDHYYEKFGRLTFPTLRSRRLEKMLDKWVWSHARGIFALNRNYLRCALKNKAPADRSVVVANACDPLYFEEGYRGERPSAPFDVGDKDVILYLGRLSWDKYCLDLVDCMARIIQKVPDAMLVCLGDGEQRAFFEERARKAGVSPHIHVAGFQSVEQIVGWAKAAKVMLGTHAGFSLIELGAAGVPAVCYNYEWHAEVVRNGETGFLVDFRNPFAMAEAAIKILQDSSLQRRMSETIRKEVVAEFEPNLLSERMRKFFEMVQLTHHNHRINLAEAYNDFCKKQRGEPVKIKAAAAGR